jgi:hypothetical protein
MEQPRASILTRQETEDHRDDSRERYAEIKIVPCNPRYDRACADMQQGEIDRFLSTYFMKVMA